MMLKGSPNTALTSQVQPVRLPGRERSNSSNAPTSGSVQPALAGLALKSLCEAATVKPPRREGWLPGSVCPEHDYKLLHKGSYARLTKIAILSMMQNCSPKFIEVN